MKMRDGSYSDFHALQCCMEEIMFDYVISFVNMISVAKDEKFSDEYIEFH